MALVVQMYDNIKKNSAMGRGGLEASAFLQLISSSHPIITIAVQFKYGELHLFYLILLKYFHQITWFDPASDGQDTR